MNYQPPSRYKKWNPLKPMIDEELLQNSATSTTQIFRNNQNYWFVQIAHFSLLPYYPQFNSEPVIVVRYMLYIDYPSVRAQYFLEYCFSSRMWQFWSESWVRARIKIVVLCCSSIFVCRFCVWMNVHKVAKKVGSSLYSLALADIPHLSSGQELYFISPSL